MVLRAAQDTLVGLERDGRKVRLRQTGTRRWIAGSGEGMDASRLELSALGRIGPVTSVVWMGLSSAGDTSTLVLGHGNSRSGAGFTEVRLAASGIAGVFKITEEEASRTAGGDRGLRTALAVACVVGGTASGSYIGLKVGEAEGDRGNSIPGMNAFVKGMGGMFIGLAVGAVAAMIIWNSD